MRRRVRVLSARIAAVYCLIRMTKRPMATLPLASIARASSTYGFGGPSGARWYAVSKYTGSMSARSTNSSRSTDLVATGMNGSSSSGSTTT